MTERDAERTKSTSIRLSDEHAAEVRRRLAESNPETLTLAELNERLKRRYGV
jgi:transposase